MWPGGQVVIILFLYHRHFRNFDGFQLLEGKSHKSHNIAHATQGAVEGGATTTLHRGSPQWRRRGGYEFQALHVTRRSLGTRLSGCATMLL